MNSFVVKSELKSRLDVATMALREAQQIILYGDISSVSTKEDGSIVTNVDGKVEDIIKAIVLNQFPHDSFLGEERGFTEGTNDYLWSGDPVDGTRSFENGQILVSSILSLSENGKTLLSAILNPYSNQLYVASEEGAFLIMNGRKFQLPKKRVEKIRNAFVNVQLSTRLTPLLEQFGMMRKEKEIDYLCLTGGSFAYNSACVADGSQTCYVTLLDKVLADWDVRSAFHIVETAGGLVTKLDGSPIILEDIPESICMSNSPEVHEGLLHLIKKYKIIELSRKVA